MRFGWAAAAALVGLMMWTGAAPGLAQDAPTVSLDGNRLVLPAPITFETGSATLTAAGRDALGPVKVYLNEKTYITTLRIEGHVSTGDGSADQALSLARAQAVAKELVNQGISCQRLLPTGFGANKPVASNDTPEGRAQNNRIELVNAALRDRAIGGMPLDGGGQVGNACP